MGRIILRYCIEQGYTVVGVIGHHDVGKDVGELIGRAPIQVAVRHPDEIKDHLKELRADVCLLATKSKLEHCEAAIMELGANGINTLTICEEAFYCWRTDPPLIAKIDKLFKENNCTFSGTGYPDVFWGELPSVLIAASHKVTKVIGESSYNFDEYGVALCKDHGVGMTEEEFKEAFWGKEPAYLFCSNQWLVDKCGWTFKNETIKMYPVLSEGKILCKSFGTDVEPNRVIGVRAVTTTSTEEGPVIEFTLLG